MKHNEDRLQQACVTWFRYKYPDLVLFAIPNGGSRNPIEAAKMKGTGTLAGVADLFLMRPAIIGTEGNWQLVHGLFIEMKAGPGKQTDKQKEFEEKAKAAGYAYELCRSIDEFQKIIKNYIR